MTSRPGRVGTSQSPRQRAQFREATDTGVGQEIIRDRPRSPDGSTRTALPSLSVEPPQRFAAEHELLLSALSARADHVLSTLATGQWPEQELDELIQYLQTEVIPQTRLEEQFLFVRTGGPSDADFNLLARDHVAIRYALEALTDAARNPDHRDRRSLTATVRNLVADLAHHLSQERAVLSRHGTDIGWQRASAAMERESHAWYPLIYAPILELDAFATSRVLEAVRRRVQRLAPNEEVLLESGADLRALCTHLLRDEAIAVHYLDDGPPTWRVRVRRRRPR